MGKLNSKVVQPHHAHCMSYRLDAWSPSRVKSATVFSASAKRCRFHLKGKL
jgi:hypothetical protein